jgi:hypothetical protein
MPTTTSDIPAVGAFAITMKGWRSQLRWAMTQREEDPARVWLEVISIDERLKVAEMTTTEEYEKGELAKFRAKLEESMRSLTEELGDDNVAPLYAWLDLVRQKRQIEARVQEAASAVKQARALRSPGATKMPESDEDLETELAHAQGELAQWQAARLAEPPPEVVAVWEANGGDALAPSMPKEPMAVGKRGEAARARLEGLGRAPGKHPWAGSNVERVAILAAGALTLVLGMLAGVRASGGLAAGAGVAFFALLGLLGVSALARQKEKAETTAALDWVWHARMYAERTGLAELEAGWLRALRDAKRALRRFEGRPASGGQLRDFEDQWPELSSIVHEVARDTETAAVVKASLAPAPAASPSGVPTP